MTDVANVVGKQVDGAGFGPGGLPYRIDETYWGYIILKQDGASSGTVVMQAVSMILGAAFLAAGLGLLVLPNMIAGSTDLMIRAVAAIIFFGFAAYLLWFASRGTQSEIQIDKALGEVREVVRNRAGKSTLIGRYGFDSIGGVFLDRANAPKRDHATLVLRYRNTAQVLPVVTGEISVLERLCKRVGKDLMMDIKPRRPERTIVPTSL